MDCAELDLARGVMDPGVRPLVSTLRPGVVLNGLEPETGVTDDMGSVIVVDHSGVRPKGSWKGPGKGS